MTPASSLATRVRTAVAAFAVAAALATGTGSFAEDVIHSHGISTFGDLKYPPDFKHFDYVDPAAPKKGDLKLSELGTFDNLNPLVNKGNLAAGIGQVYETLMKSSLDEA